MGAVLVSDAERLRTALAGRYDLDEEIGRGGMARVYRAHDRQHGRSVAIKVLRPEVAAALGAERFLREIRIEAALQHPGIIPLHDSGSADGVLYAVMPYVEGESLRERIRRERQLSVEESVRITREIADALDYAHQQGIVHRDIKPANILLSNGHAVVADFGIARALSAADPESMTASGIAVGTPEYMSPEQTTGGPTDIRTDIYALGCVLYEMLAGQPPFTAPTAQAVLARHRHDTLPSLAVVRPNLPAKVTDAVERALAKVPADRFPTAAAFAQSLTGDLTLQPSSVRHRPRWHHAVLGGLALVIVAVTLVLVARHLRGGYVRDSSTAVVIVPFDRPEESKPPARPTASEHVAFSEAIEWVPGLRAVDGSPLMFRRGGVRTVQFPILLRGARQLGGRYLVTGSVVPLERGSRVIAEVFSTVDGTRIMRAADSSAGGDLVGAVSLLALSALKVIAERENLDLGARRAMFSSTSSPMALGQLLDGQDKFWHEDFDGAAAAFARAIEADSLCGLAYLRLATVEGWRYEYGSALKVLDAGLGLRPRLSARWVNLLEARRSFVLGDGERAIDQFQNAVLDHRDDIDGWLGLGESLFHLAGYTGHVPTDAQAALERTVELDSAFVPIYDHLVDLALVTGDSARAARYVRHMPLVDPSRQVRDAAIALRFGGPAAKAEAHRRLRASDRQALSQVIALWTQGSRDLPLADTLASYLTGSDRTPDDRRRGAQNRLVALAGLGRWREALEVWQRDAGDRPFDAWLVQAALAGYPTDDILARMLAWARARVARREIPDFRLPPWDESRGAFEALAHRATLMGDSAETLDLLERMRMAPAATDPTDPAARSLQASLKARLALLAGDTVEAIASLRGALERINEPYTWYYPLTSMAPERRLLADLLRARGDATGAKRWYASFLNSWSMGDVFFAKGLNPAFLQTAR
jgi:serine/threonine-protein kinase